MINPFDYLYYKMYRAWSCINGGGNPVTHIGAMGMLLVLNFLTIYLLIYGQFPSNLTEQLLNGDYASLIVFVGGICIILFIYPFFYVTKRGDKIIAKYSQESEKSRMIGNAAVVLYVIVTIVAFILILRAHMPAPPEEPKKWWEMKK